MRALVTGGSGFLGSHLVDRLMTGGDEVTVLDHAPRCSTEVRYVQGDIRDEALVEQLVAECEIVYHLAGLVGVGNVLDAGAAAVVEVNVNGTQHVLRAASQTGARVVYTSTSEVAGKGRQVPFSEDQDRVVGSTLTDRWVYAESKALGEHLCLDYAARGLPVTAVRLFNVYGPRLEGRVVTDFARKLLSGESVTIIGDGSQTRAFTYVSDVVDGLLLAGNRPQALGDVFNLGSDVETSINSLVIQLAALIGCSPEIRYVSGEEVYGPGYEDIPRRVPDVSKARDLLGFEARTALTDGLELTLQWLNAEVLAA